MVLIMDNALMAELSEDLVVSPTGADAAIVGMPVVTAMADQSGGESGGPQARVRV